MSTPKPERRPSTTHGTSSLNADAAPSLVPVTRRVIGPDGVCAASYGGLVGSTHQGKRASQPRLAGPRPTAQWNWHREKGLRASQPPRGGPWQPASVALSSAHVGACSARSRGRAGAIGLQVDAGVGDELVKGKGGGGPQRPWRAGCVFPRGSEMRWRSARPPQPPLAARWRLPATPSGRPAAHPLPANGRNRNVTLTLATPACAGAALVSALRLGGGRTDRSRDRSEPTLERAAGALGQARAA